MAQIRPYISQQEAQQQLQNTNTPSQPGDFGGQGLANIGEGISNLAQGVFQGQKLIYDNTEREESLRAHTDVIKAHTDIANEIYERTNAWKLGDPMPSTGMQDKIRSKLDKLYYDENGTSRYTTNGGDRAFKLSSAQTTAHFTDVLRTNDSSVAGKAAKLAHEDVTNALQLHVYGSPSEFNVSKDKLDGVAASYTHIDGMERHRIAVDGARRLALSYAQGRIDQDPSGAQKELSSIQAGSPLEYLDAGHIAGLKDKADTAVKSERAQKDLLLDAAFKDRRAERAAGVNNGFNPEAESAHITDPSLRTLKIKDGMAAIVTGNAVTEMDKGSFNENMERLERGRAALKTSGNFTEDLEAQAAREHVMAQRTQAIANDLVAETLKSPAVARAYKEMDYGNPATVDRYVRAQQAETARIAPFREVSLLPKAYTSTLKKTMGDMDSGPQGADKAMRDIGAERQRWGQYWPIVLKQLTREEVLNGNQAVAARMGQDPGKEPDAKLLLSIDQLKPHEIDKQIAPGLRTEVEKHLQQAMVPVAEALLGQVGGEREMARYRQASETLALAYLMRGETSASKAVEKALGRVVKNDFHWQGGYHVPLQYDPDSVRRGTQAELHLVPVLPNTDKDPLVAGEHDVSKFGKRADGTPKGTGWFGVLNNRKNGGVSTELSTDDPIDASGKKVQHPLLVPTLTRREIEHLLDGGKDANTDKAIYEKAAAHARKRLSSGLSPYPGPGEQGLLPQPTGRTHVILPTDLSGQRQSDIKLATEDALLNRSRWKGNRDGTGLDLTWETGEQVMIRHADGSVVPYSRTYEQLSRLGTEMQSATRSGGQVKVPNAY